MAKAIALHVVGAECLKIASVKASTFFRSGKIEYIKEKIQLSNAELLIVNHSLSPLQQSQMEKLFQCKVIDRTGLILEIFSERAQTKEGRLQVGLAQLQYQKSRLVRSWTHLERQRGGRGFLAGPGERQLESDRRQIQEKILHIEKQLKTIVNTRHLSRRKRKKNQQPIIALVGYTNAGKSTLFNALTQAGVTAKDMLFATLDPTLRKITLPSKNTAILSDTVGFISDLPPFLIAAFRSTLEEVVEADLILHVRDMADKNNINHAQDVLQILQQLAINTEDSKKILEVWNKIDLVSPELKHSYFSSASTSRTEAYPVSALTGEGIDALLCAIEKRLEGETHRFTCLVTSQQLPLLAQIYKGGANIQENENSQELEITVELTEKTKTQLERQGLVLKRIL